MLWSCSCVSVLDRHEIAYIFGQLTSPHSVPSLLVVLSDTKEDEMVRHEAAEALGSIATPDVLPSLIEWNTREDSPRVVKESCQVALDVRSALACKVSSLIYLLQMYDYEASNQLDYAPRIVEEAVKPLEALPRAIVA